MTGLPNGYQRDTMEETKDDKKNNNESNTIVGHFLRRKNEEPTSNTPGLQGKIYYNGKLVFLLGDSF